MVVMKKQSKPVIPISDQTGEERLSLLAKEESHCLLIENLPTSVMVYSPDTRIVRCNPEAAQLLGMSADQLLGRDARDPVWHFVREDGTRMTVDEFPVSQVIATKAAGKNAWRIAERTGLPATDRR